jgi:hypothetical protein
MKRAVVLENRISGPLWPKTAVNLHKLIRIIYLFVKANTYQIGKCESVIELMKIVILGC